MNHMSFTVSNLEKSIDFYQNVLGLKLVDVDYREKSFSEQVTGIKGAHLKIAYLETSNCAVELIQYLSPEGCKLDARSCNVGSAHVCFFVENFNEMVDKLRKKKVVFAGVPSIVSAGPNKGRGVLYFEDPDSNTIEFISCEVVEQ